MALEKEKKVQKESKVVEGFKLGFGIYVAFLTSTLILLGLTAAIWWVTLATR